MRRLEKDLEGLEVMLVDTHTHTHGCFGLALSGRGAPQEAVSSRFLFFFSGQMRSWKVISKVSFLLTMVKN